jgi:deoxyadenosine/deoxycytidine kinase
VLEPVEENVFLHGFYDDPRALAFRTQLFFLVNRLHQQREIADRLAGGADTVSDYAFWKDSLFARLNLDAEELALYEEIYDLVAPHAPRPDVLVLLRCDVGTLLERIRARGRTFEGPLTRDYLELVVAAYDAVTDRATLVLDATEDVDALSRRVESHVRASP